MACMISFSLLDSVADLEKLSHPSHKTWFKSLALLRDMGLNTPRKKGDMQLIEEFSYCCVDQEHPEQVVYLYPQCSDKNFKAIEAMCSSETSQLRRLISPLLKMPLSAASVSRYNGNLRLIFPRAIDGAPKCLEFMTLHNPEHPMILFAFLDWHMPGPSCAGLSYVPVRSYSTARLESPDGDDNVFFHCIEWKSLPDRAAVYADPFMRRKMKRPNADHRAPFLQALGKTEDELTWEEDLSVFFDATCVKKIERRFVTATFITDDYLGLSKKEGRPCVVL